MRKLKHNIVNVNRLYKITATICVHVFYSVEFPCTKYNYAINYVMVNLIEIKNNGKCTNKSLKIVHENSYSRNFIISL